MIPLFAAATVPLLWRRRNLWAVLGVAAAVIGIQFLVLIRDSAAGLGIIPFTAVMSVAFWGVGLYLQKRSHRTLTAEAAAPVKTFA